MTNFKNKTKTVTQLTKVQSVRRPQLLSCSTQHSFTPQSIRLGIPETVPQQRKIVSSLQQSLSHPKTSLGKGHGSRTGQVTETKGSADAPALTRPTQRPGGAAAAMRSHTSAGAGARARAAVLRPGTSRGVA